MTKKKPKRSEMRIGSDFVDAAWWQTWPALVLSSGFVMLEAIVFAWRGRKNVRNDCWQEGGV